MEVWKQIPSYKDYIINNKGDIKSLNYRKTGKIKIINQHCDSYGYKRATLNRQSKQVHRLVAETFLENYNQNLQVNHKDGNKQNNCVDNLEMCTNKENSQHRTLVLKKGNITPVYMIDKKTNKIIRTFNSTREAGRIINIDHSTISKVCNNKKITAGGYKWKYKEK